MVVLAGNIFINVVTDGDYKTAQRLFIKKAGEALKHGGYIYLDFNLLAHPEIFFNCSSERVHFDGTDDTGVYGRYIGCTGTYDTETQMTNGKSRTELLLPNGESYVFECKTSKHIPTLRQVRDWLTEFGFRIEQEYGDYDRNPVSELTHRAILYAKKA
ncbi:hypothetical protein SDC9_173370 [bioreactor metagenome]|uniref:Uncharacterized protein n=1 Tax=bioreactor metagenome TaxID=1076179 RepID=A0A645GJE7_9ZZZZ